MRINAITNWAYGVTLLLTAMSSAAFILSTRSADQERVAVERHLALDTLAEELALGAEERTDEARLYVMRGDERHLRLFKDDEAKESALEASINNMRSMGGGTAELAALEEVERDADALDVIEKTAIAAFAGGDTAGAQQALFGPDHERLQTDLLETVTRFRELTTTRSGIALEQARASSDMWSAIAKVMLAITAALFLGVLYFVLRRRVAKPLMQMTGIVTRLARQDYAVEVPIDGRRDEIGEMNEAIHIFRTNGLERDRLDAERRQDQQTKDLILQMMHRLQACQNQTELADVVSRFAPQIFPGLAGRLYVMNDSRSLLTDLGSWLEPRHSALSFIPSECWALRRGHLHVSNKDHTDISCQHIDSEEVAGLCVPLTAQGDTIGLLYFEERSADVTATEVSRLYLELIAENIGLATANLQLREKLTNLAIRDSLTNLFNRRCLDETLNRHARDESGRALSCMMIDIDHFKHFNDTFGHDAGDAVMRYVAEIMTDMVGDRGSVYRFGGEEFTVLLPGIAGKEAFEAAEQIRAKIGATGLSHRGRILGAVSISIGLASYPMDGPVASLLGSADATLLQAKAEGRNRTVLAGAVSKTHAETSD